MADFESLTERMYEAVFLPEMWVPLLDDLARQTGSSVGGIGTYWPQPRGMTTSFELTPYAREWDRSPDARQALCSYLRSKRLINTGFFEVDLVRGDWSDMPGIEHEREDYLARGCYGPQAGVMLELFNGELVTLEFARQRGEQRYESELLTRLNRLYPAFRQAAFFASRLHFERAHSHIEALNDLGLPAAILGPGGQVLASNDLFEGSGAYMSQSPSGHIALRGSDVLRRSFAQALERAVTESTYLAIPADQTRHGAVIHFMPLCRNAKTLFSISGAIMVVTPVATTIGVPAPDLVAQFFGLTQAQARLAVSLASGLSLRDSAAQQSITEGTARGYLNRVFTKTGTGQQSELVSLLKSLRPRRQVAHVLPTR